MKRALLLLGLCAAPLQAQSAGSTGMQVLQFNAGARAAAFAGAYSAARGDADILFYNPAGAASLKRAASAAYETQTIDVAYGSAAGLTHFGRWNVGASVSYLDAGKVNEIIPDPNLGGNVGTGTGNTASASETAARLSAATTFRDARLRVGASIGYVSSSIADATESSPFADAGAQYDAHIATLGLAIRNIGSNDMPTEARLGAARTFAITHLIGAALSADAIARLRESSFGLAAGVEAGLLPSATSEIGAVVRAGFDSEANQLGAFRFGAGITLRSMSVDYAFQDLDIVGVVHRIGVRWSVR